MTLVLISGDMWKYGCPKSSVWSSNGVEWAGSEGTSSLVSYEHNVGNLALEVVGQNWSSEVISLCLEDWEVGRVALSCHLSVDLFMPRNEGCVREELRVAGFSSFTVFRVPGRKEPLPHCVHNARVALVRKCHCSKAFLSPWTDVTTKERDVVREMKEKERERRAFFLSCIGLPVSSEFLLQFKHGVLLERRCPVLSFVPPCCVNSLKG